MRHKLFALLLAGALLLTAGGCSLAQPEKTDGELPGGDRWVGFYVVYDPPGTYTDFYDNPHLTELGSTTLDTGKYGEFSIPRQVLLGVEDPDTGDFSFPGLTGYSLFIYHRQEAHGPVTGVQSDMSPSEKGFAITSTDEGTAESAAGVIWWGPPADAPADWDPYEDGDGIWHAYKVYETAEGQVYLTSGGNTYSGGNLGGMGFSTDSTYTYTENGESKTGSLHVSVDVEYTPRLTALRLVEFAGDNTVVRTTDLPLAEELPTLTLSAETQWLVVEEESAQGVERTLYTRADFTQESLSHEVILLDHQGLGHGSYLTILPG